MLSAPRKAHCVIQSKSEGLRIKGTEDVKLNIQKMTIMASGPITSWEIDGEAVEDLFFWAPKSLQMVIAAMK